MTQKALAKNRGKALAGSTEFPPCDYKRYYYDCYVIRETEKARLLEMRETGIQLWVPMSVTQHIITCSVPADFIGTIPGKPAVVRVDGWYRGKNKQAFGD